VLSTIRPARSRGRGVPAAGADGAEPFGVGYGLIREELAELRMRVERIEEKPDRVLRGS